MGLLSNILTGIGIAGAPFTGGASLALAGLGAGGSILSGMASGQATDRTNANNQALAQDRNALDAYGTRQSALTQLLGLQERGALDRAKLGIEAPAARTSQLVRGSLLQNVQPFKVTPPAGSRVKIPQISGGLTPAALSSMARAGGGELQRQALLAMLTGSDVPAMPDMSKALLDAPTPSKLKGPGGFEQFAGILGPILSGVSSIGGAMGQRSSSPMTMSNQMPGSYTGMDAYGNSSGFQLPRPGLLPNLNARQNTSIVPFARGN